MIEVHHVSKTFGKKQILKDINFEVKPGERVVIVGKNGSGKTTLLRIMTGIIKADTGEIQYFNEKVQSNGKVFRKYCGYVPQENPLIDELTVSDNLKLWSQNNEVKKNITHYSRFIPSCFHSCLW